MMFWVFVYKPQQPFNGAGLLPFASKTELQVSADELEASKSTVTADKHDANTKALAALNASLHNMEVGSLSVLGFMVWCALYFGLSDNLHRNSEVEEIVLATTLLVSNLGFRHSF